MAKKSYNKINNINNLRQQKRKLNTKLKIRKHLFNKHLRDLEEDFSGDYLFRQSLKTFKLDNPVFNFLPVVFRNLKLSKLTIPIIGGVSVTAGLLFLLNRKKDKNEDS